MILRGARVAISPVSARTLDITIRGARIVKLGDAGSRDAIDLSSHLILPGLINAHDHLSFNLFPLLARLRTRTPPNGRATSIRPDESPVREHRMVPRATRLAWGG